ncbi:MAG: hypothetical protein V7L20_31770 [Nostoc sp.]|uniref:hypothetical protein n=1 Tax=Nostoc sp. TaxID=1180 RepID=UPI002FF676D1
MGRGSSKSCDFTTSQSDRLCQSHVELSVVRSLNYLDSLAIAILLSIILNIEAVLANIATFLQNITTFIRNVLMFLINITIFRYNLSPNPYLPPGHTCCTLWGSC